jgi:ribosome recycling factor
VQPHDPSIMQDIDRALRESKLGINPSNDGRLIRLPIPELSEERRRDLVKRAKTEAENAKIGVRNNRKDAIDMIKDLKNEGLSEDMVKVGEEEVQKITNNYIKKVDELLDVKEKDIMTI